MESTIILKTLFIFIILWGIGAAFLIFRPRIPLVWKIAAILLFLFYLWFFKEQIINGLLLVKADWYKTLLLFLKEIVFLMFYLLFVFWPLALIIIFYKADDIGASHLLQFMVIYTVIVWIGVIIYTLLKKDIDLFLYNKLIHLIPFAK